MATGGINADDLKRELQRQVRDATRDAGQRMRTVLTQRTPHLIWRYGHDPRATFPPHLALDGHKLESWEDAALDANPGAFPHTAHYFPGDHAGCLCDYEVGYDRTFRTAAAWTQRPHDNGRRFVVDFRNRRYEPEKLTLPPARSRVASPGRRPIAVRARQQVPTRVAFFHREILTQQRFAAEVQISLAVAGRRA